MTEVTIDYVVEEGEEDIQPDDLFASIPSFKRQDIDAAAFLAMSDDEVIHQYYPMVEKIVHHARTNTVCSFDDLRQEALIALVVAHRNYNPEFGAKPFTWAYRSVKDAISSYQRNNLSCLSGSGYFYEKMKNTDDVEKKEKEKELESTLQASFSSAEYSPAIENAIGAPSEMLLPDSKLAEAIETLSPQQKQIFVLRYGLDGGHPVKVIDIAKDLHLTVKMVAYHLKTGKQKLRRYPQIAECLVD